MPKTRFSARLLQWYARNARDLPWRSKPSAYRTWISEIMLQQTRVEAVRPFFQRWMRRFPSIRHLASASEEDVLAAWEGLGYYARARNLQRAARRLVRDFRGNLPSDPDGLRKLPGIGAYTSAAIASIAFGKDVAALDGNVRRVLARVFCVEAPVDSRRGEARLAKLASENLPRGRAGHFNQALMDLGSSVCLPRRPRCEACPVATLCGGRRRNLQTRLPVRTAKPRAPRYVAGAAVIRHQKEVLLRRRTSSGLLGGMWEFPKSDLQPELTSAGRLRRKLASGLPGLSSFRILPGAILTVVPHAYSHFHLTVHAFLCLARSNSTVPGLRWARVNDLGSYPMGRIDRKIADRLQKELT